MSRERLQSFLPGRRLPWSMILILCLIISLSASRGADGQDSEPRKADLIQFLDQVVDLLEAEQYEQAVERFHLPEDFPPKQLSTLIPQDIINRDVVRYLEQQGQFGPVGEVFSETRRQYVEGKAKHSVDRCFGFNVKLSDKPAELMVEWKDGAFRQIIWMTSLGHLQPSDEDHQPLRGKFLQNLKVATYLLEQGDYDRAAKLFAQPPGFEPAMLAGLVEKQETSLAGVKRLQEEGRFASAVELFGADRAQRFADKFSVDVTRCFGFRHEAEQETGEVLAWIDDDQFQLIRLDDVGKIAEQNPFPEVDFAGKPDKATLVRTLEVAFELIDGFQFEQATQLFRLPDDFEPQELAMLIAQGEVSSAGIALMRDSAQFGLAGEIFGEQRAEQLANRANVDPAECYGMSHQTDRDTGEVMAHWTGKRFQIFRLNNVAKMVAADPDTSEKDPNAGKTIPDKPKSAPAEGEDGDESKSPKMKSDQPATPAPKESSPQAGPISREEAAKMLPELEAAVADQPSDVAARGRYAMALNRVGNFPAAWKQLMEGHRLQPGHGGIAKGIETVFRTFEGEGLFTVGVPAETILALLGEPTQSVKLGANAKRMVYVFMGVDLADGRVVRTIDLRGVTEALFEKDELLELNLPLGWICSLRRINRQSTSEIYFPAGQTVKEWSEKVEIQRFPGLADKLTAPQAVEMMSKQLAQGNEGAVSRVLEQSDKSAIVANVLPLAGDRREYQLVRFILGPDDLHRIGIAIRGEDLPKTTQAQWLKRFKAATLKLQID